ncbi:MAG: rhodanese-like domain-containing protein [Alphaproteobacteria bacterium]|nr:rhodanese-like domain-containing protein [Alphaproteobacteria bacterium]
MKTIAAATLDKKGVTDGIIVDVRTGMEHGEKRLTCPHVHAPLDTLDPQNIMLRHGLDASAPVYLLCRSGKRATQAAEKFMAAGYPNVTVIEGGIMACEDCGHPVAGEAAKPAGSCASSSCAAGPITLERQVRIAAGAFTAIGALLALTVSAGFAVIPLLVGGGLVFAGVTDKCGLALVLTKAPWNKPKTACASSAPQPAKTGACS